MKNKIAIFFALIICFGTFFSASAAKEVQVKENNISVYVAGNYDLYPIEYYDKEEKAYKGLIPELLSSVSKSTGISFIYLEENERRTQKELSKNLQAELTTAILSSDNSFKVKEKYPVITIKENGEEVTYCIGFTEIASQSLCDSIKSALDKISEKEKAGILLSYAQSTRPMPKLQVALILSSVIFSSALITAAVFLIVIFKNKKKDKTNDMIDPLCGIGNGQYYIHAFQNLISYQARSLYNVSYISFDKEKNKNALGSNSLTDIEKYAAAHLNAKIASAEYLSRTDDGTFVIIYQAENHEEAERRIKEIVTSLNKYIFEFTNEKEDLFKAGICRLSQHLDLNAETALFNAKQGYLNALKNNILYSLGSEKQLAEIKKAEKLRSSISAALDNREFKAYMQFIVGAKSGKICGGEILSRWQNKEYGLLRPEEYIDILKEADKILEHDYYIFECTCRQIEKWQGTPFEKMFLTCNFTRTSFSSPDFAKRIKDIAEKYAFPYQRLMIEITENSQSETSEIVSQNIKRCSELGFKIAIDDMGAGFTSLADIYDNEIDVVKIERNFITSCCSTRREKMLEDIISLIHNAGAKVICEGIETKEQHRMLNKIGTDMLQGFYYARVLPVSECEKFIYSKLKS